jgi:AraC-like DNA-binding protein
MRLYIKNITCKCCELFVRNTLQNLGVHVKEMNQGEIILSAPVSTETLALLETTLTLAGLGLLREEQSILVERIKSELRRLINEPTLVGKFNLSTHLGNRLHYNYAYLSNYFSQSEGKTIRDYMIDLRIEQIKRLLVQEDLDLVAISTRLNYSSTAHLAAQFKKITGKTTTEFKREWQTSPLQQRLAHH